MSRPAPSTLDATEQESQVLAGDRENRRLSENLLTSSRNPALARLAGVVRDQSASGSVESYSRMHHRHNRS